MSEFFVGQKVVCVDDGLSWEDGHRLIIPIDGHIYTVRAVDPVAEGLLLVEIMNPPEEHIEGFCEPEWEWNCFLPLEEKADPIEIFREIARGVSGGRPIIEDAEYRPSKPEKVTP